ncbi:heavy-metal-associated domain-containing protein [Nocardia sp. NPDC052566]|uniref:heavy-metal-associated domain-containing protein n=1 Tax=Nocardia sp. NPDC052566 TaxID=3364330 RepID=UPI0037C97CD5
MTYTITLPNVTREGAVVVEQQLRGLNGVEYVDIDVPSETATVTATLTYAEVLDAIRQSGIPAN